MLRHFVTSQTSPRLASLAGCLLLAMTVGCLTEVGTGPVAKDSSETDAPTAEVSTEIETEETVDTPAAESIDLPEADAPSATEANTEPMAEEKLPWEQADEPTAASDEAEKFFGGSENFTAKKTDSPPEAEEPPTETAATGFEAELLNAYEGLEIASESTPKETTDEPTFAVQPSMPTTTPSVTLPITSPTTTGPSDDYRILDPVKIPELTRHPKQPKKSNTVAEVEPAPETLIAEEEPLFPWETPPQPEVPKDNRYKEATPIAETPALEPLPTETVMETLPPPKRPTILQPEMPRLASLNPLPAVPVLRYNTRHLAWLLGGKLGLSRLAKAEGATPYEIAQWTEETNRLAKQLKVTIPPASSSDTTIGRQVAELLNAAAKASSSMAAKHDPSHAALLEISLKTNALLVLCQQYPELAAPTARAVEAAAERAELPGFLWRKMNKVLLANSTPDEIFEAITQMHDSVESYLR